MTNSLVEGKGILEQKVAGILGGRGKAWTSIAAKKCVNLSSGHWIVIGIIHEKLVDGKMESGGGGGREGGGESLWGKGRGLGGKIGRKWQAKLVAVA